MALKEDYLDDILDTSVNEKRKYRMIDNADDTISLEDVTEYSQNGDNFGAYDINITNKTVNELIAMGLNVRCNSDGYLEVLVDGVWEQTDLKAIDDKDSSVLFNAEKGNAANFALYAGATNNQTNNYFGGQLTMDVGDTLVYKGTYNDYWACGCIISDPIDLTNYSKLIFNYSTKATIAKNYNFMNAFVVTTKQQSMTSVAHKVILNPSTTGQSGVAEIDIANITGYQYIGFEMSCGNGTVTFELNEAHLE